VWFSCDQDLETILLFVGGRVALGPENHDDDDDDDDDTLLSDFFDYWRRHFSLDRIPRVTGRRDDASRAEPIPRTAASLDRMRWEASMLGFGAKHNHALSLSVDWVDAEGIEEEGFVPIAACVSADCSIYPSDVEEEEEEEDPVECEFDAFSAFDGAVDYEAWACFAFDRLCGDRPPLYGFYIDEFYGPCPILVKTWGDWDLYLQGCMWPSHDDTPRRRRCGKDLLVEVLPLCSDEHLIAERIVDLIFDSFAGGELNPVCSLLNSSWICRKGEYARYSIRRTAFEMMAELEGLLVATGAAVY